MQTVSMPININFFILESCDNNGNFFFDNSFNELGCRLSVNFIHTKPHKYIRKNQIALHKKIFVISLMFYNNKCVHSILLFF